jgi:hypothetical protein
MEGCLLFLSIYELSTFIYWQDLVIQIRLHDIFVNTEVNEIRLHVIFVVKTWSIKYDCMALFVNT